MSARVDWYLPTLTALCAGGALLGGPDLIASAAFGSLALVFGGLTCARVVGWRPFASTEGPDIRWAGPAAVRVLLRNGREGREEILLWLDDLARRARPGPGPVRPRTETERILRLSPSDFARHLAARLAFLEGSS